MSKRTSKKVTDNEAKLMLIEKLMYCFTHLELSDWVSDISLMNPINTKYTFNITFYDNKVKIK